MIIERIGWEQSLTVLKVKVRELRPLFALPDPASRTQYRLGELTSVGLRPRTQSHVSDLHLFPRYLS